MRHKIKFTLANHNLDDLLFYLSKNCIFIY